MATYSSLNNSWQQLYTKGNNMKVPERELLTRTGVYLKKRPEPEVVEHMLDDLETKMRNYFILYNREREFRKKSEENCYRLEQEVLNYKQKLEESNNKFHCMEKKVKSMVDQPLKLKETIERIELLYNQMDTLIQAFVGIGSCAVIQGYSRVAFIKLCLEYLYPCRELDIRLNTLYNALYNVLIQYDGLEVTKNELMKPMTYHDTQEKTKLTGISVKVHRLMLKCDLPETKSFGCFFRYDNEPKELRETEFSRFISVGVRPMDNASKVYEFNSLIQHNTLPPKVPNMVPKLVLDIYADALLVGSAEVSLISDKTLKPSEPWNVLDSNGMNCGDVVVTVIPMPQTAKLPAVNFRNKPDELVSETKTVDPQITRLGSTMGDSAEPTRQSPQTGNQPEPSPQTSKPSEPNKPFEPKMTPPVRKPLFNPKTTAAAKQGQTKGQGKGPSSNVSRLSQMFARKKNNQQAEETSGTPDADGTTADANTSQPAPPADKDTPDASSQTEKAPSIDRKSSNKLGPAELPNTDKDVNELQRKRSNIKDMIIKKLSSRKLSKDNMTEDQPKPSVPEPKADTAKTGQATPEKVDAAQPKPVEEAEKTQVSPEPKKASPPQQTPPKTEQPSPVPAQPSPPETAPAVPTKAAKLPPEPARKVGPKMPMSQPVVETKKEPGDQLPDKPLLPIAITPKLLKKPAPKKK
ncbi:hypothetical protein MACJ_001220 [Theileria orientalis]|uniref:Uncharacterized protein n=1 Tax=Theileria orientalis TaxID=68886 RepID=A0A976QRC7_THEOR|nr:hypothetical protein MACJ_001220 [Theileria orientalis]